MLSSKQAWQRNGLEKKWQTSEAGVVGVPVVVVAVVVDEVVDDVLIDRVIEVLVLVRMHELQRTGQVVRANWPKPPKDAQYRSKS